MNLAGSSGRAVTAAGASTATAGRREFGFCDARQTSCLGQTRREALLRTLLCRTKEVLEAEMTVQFILAAARRVVARQSES